MSVYVKIKQALQDLRHLCRQKPHNSKILYMVYSVILQDNCLVTYTFDQDKSRRSFTILIKTPLELHWMGGLAFWPQCLFWSEYSLLHRMLCLYTPGCFREKNSTDSVLNTNPRFYELHTLIAPTTHLPRPSP